MSNEKTINAKVFRIAGSSCYDCGGNEYAVGCSDWQKLTQEEYDLMVDWIEKQRRTQHVHEYALVTDLDMEEIQIHIGDMRVIAAEEKRIKKEKAVEAERKRVDKLLKKQAFDEAQELALLKKLQEKHGDKLNDTI